jgi:hypothetical protein
MGARSTAPGKFFPVGINRPGDHINLKKPRRRRIQRIKG